MEIHGVPLGGRPLLAYHDHNGAGAARRGCCARAGGGRSVAYASEAGTPLVADPGFALARAAIAAGLPVTAAPGASAVLAALAWRACRPTGSCSRASCPPRRARATPRCAELAAVPATLVLYEAPRAFADS